MKPRDDSTISTTSATTSRWQIVDNGLRVIRKNRALTSDKRRLHSVSEPQRHLFTIVSSAVLAAIMTVQSNVEQRK